ncbi:PIN domain-containing protein [Flavihumibacter sp. ZG627]|uniref:PIN domain-containing protein n=1 Tax=Flavihumibacter sp. ZG627 TaxID=1463156 RepID=UPI00057E3ACB|nr:PIN domain-containing protein [Flavihumibacter sp. ZG627]KIC91945.1 twitching motility protein PilT [Flavihumibacter sp. ZG627]
MSGKEILVDTNIFLYLLKGNDTLEEMLHGKNIYVSFITELELIGFKNITLKEQKQIEVMLGECVLLSLNGNIKEKYVEVRRKYHLKLADAIIAATAIASNIPLITSDKQFTTVKELKLVTYQM